MGIASRDGHVIMFQFAFLWTHLYHFTFQPPYKDWNGYHPFLATKGHSQNSMATFTPSCLHESGTINRDEIATI